MILPSLKLDRRLLEAVGAHRAQPLIGDELPALLVAVVAVHEGVFLGLPVEALELVGVCRLALLAEHALHVVGDARRDQAVGHGLAGRVHVALGQPHPPLAVHRGEVHLARGRRRQPDMAGLADLGRHDVDVDGEQAALLDRVHDRLDHARPIAIGHRRHGVLHHVGALLVGLLELERVQRRLVMVAAPDVVDAALALDQQLVDVGGRPPDMGIGGPRITFLVAAHAHAAAARTPDVAGRERDVHERAVGAVVVVAPDQALLVGEHRAPPSAAFLRLSDPLRRTCVI